MNLLDSIAKALADEPDPKDLYAALAVIWGVSREEAKRRMQQTTGGET